MMKFTTLLRYHRRSINMYETNWSWYTSLNDTITKKYLTEGCEQFASKLRKFYSIYLFARLGGGSDVSLHRSSRPRRGAHAVVHLLLIILKINIKIRRDNCIYGDDVNGIIVIQSSTSFQNSEEVVGYKSLMERQMNNLHTDTLYTTYW